MGGWEVGMEWRGEKRGKGGKSKPINTDSIVPQSTLDNFIHLS